MQDRPGLSLALADDGVLLVTLQGEGPMNSLNAIHLEGIARLWREVSADDAVRVVVVTGEGKAFSAGGNLREERANAANYKHVERAFATARDLVVGMIDCDKPIVSAVNGPAVGGGLVVALLADISIVGHDATLADGHVRIGLTAGDHAAVIWPLLCGIAKAKRYLLTGESLDGRTASEIGLVSMSTENDRVLAEAMAVAQRLAQAPSAALAWTKRTLNHWLRDAIPAFEASLAMEMLGHFGPDFAEGLDAFLERRKPTFS
jgi:enoyl-CoA hydratase